MAAVTRRPAFVRGTMPSSSAISSRGSPALATTYEGGNSDFLAQILPIVDCLEITPDAIAEVRNGKPDFPKATITELKAAATQAKILVHGVGLSIGSYDGYSQQYIQLLDRLLTEVPVVWHSEHLGYTSVDGKHMGTMLAMPKTRESLEMLCGRVNEIQDRYGLPFMLENVVHMLPDYPGDFTEAGFLNALSSKTGCGILLDVYNLECDVHNHGWDIEKFLGELDLKAVREIHIAGGVLHKGMKLDVHSRLTADSTIELVSA